MPPSDPALRRSTRPRIWPAPPSIRASKSSLLLYSSSPPCEWRSGAHHRASQQEESLKFGLCRTNLAYADSFHGVVRRAEHPLLAEKILTLSFSVGCPTLAGLVFARVGPSNSNVFSFRPALVPEKVRRRANHNREKRHHARQHRKRS